MRPGTVSSLGGMPEANTVPFKEVDDSEGTIILEEVTDFASVSE